jgi:signal peptidase II
MPSPLLLSASSVPANLKNADHARIDALPASGRFALRYAVFAAIAVVACALDLLTKQWVFAWRGMPQRDNAYWIIEPYFGFETSCNPGALFGMGAGYSHLFALLSVVAAVGIVVWLSWGQAIRDRWLVVALGLVMGGIFGNLYDRLGLWHYAGMPEVWRNNVRDWILFQYPAPWQNWQLVPWPNFNIADMCLVVGAGILVMHAFLTPVDKESPAAPAK